MRAQSKVIVCGGAGWTLTSAERAFPSGSFVLTAWTQQMMVVLAATLPVVVADQRGAFVDVGGEQAGDVADRHVQVPKSPDDLGGRNLVGGVVAVARVRVDLVGREQLRLVIVPQRLHAQVRHHGLGKVVASGR